VLEAVRNSITNFNKIITKYKKSKHFYDLK